MKFPESFTRLLGKTKNAVEYYFSLIVERDGASVASWSLGTNNELQIAGVAHGVLQEDTWDARISVVDQLLSAAEDKAHTTIPITKTVFGMPATYLTPEGNIIAEIRTHLKKLTSTLELTAVGFVPLTQAIAFSLKKEEGVPASVILVHCTKDILTVSLYRVGICVREQSRAVNESAATTLEEFFSDAPDNDVLPSRILLYGADEQTLERVRGSFLKHQWPSKANFLHFPKIEVIAHEDILRAVSLAGSFELTASIGEDATLTADGQGSTVVAQPTRDEKDAFVIEDATSTIGVEKQREEDDKTTEAEESGSTTEQPMHVSSEEDEDVENVQLVDAQTLGFGSEDVVNPHEAEPKRKKFTFSLPKLISIRAVKLPRFFSLGGSHRTLFPVVGFIAIALLIGLLYYFVPRASVTVYVLPASLSETATLIVDSSATIVDSATKTIPGMTQNLSLSAQKTVPVTGKKSVGDPAKGTVTFYNKITSERTLKKGTVLTAKGVSFSLDEEINIASASESIGSITFGKKDGTITAIDIGVEGNVAASSEFVVKDISSSSLLARNDVALKGGVSREVTVVSRADYDGVLKTLTDEIITKAKAQLLTEVGGNRLIEQTITTKVTEKIFDKELDQEAKELSGNVTAAVSGIVLRDEDIKSLLLSLITPKLPSGYSFTDGKLDVSVGAAQVKKDGKITVAATVTATALPIINTENLRADIKGTSVTDALSHFKGLVGVAGAEFRFVLSPTNKRLPINKANIIISLAVQ